MEVFSFIEENYLGCNHVWEEVQFIDRVCGYSSYNVSDETDYNDYELIDRYIEYKCKKCGERIKMVRK